MAAMATVVEWVAWAVWICDQRASACYCMFEESPARAGFSFWCDRQGALTWRSNSRSLGKRTKVAERHRLSRATRWICTLRTSDCR